MGNCMSSGRGQGAGQEGRPGEEVEEVVRRPVVGAIRGEVPVASQEVVAVPGSVLVERWWWCGWR